MHSRPERQGILQSQFFIPRQRWYFTGRATRNVEFYTVINRGYGSLDLLDAFISYRIDERLRFRAGRMKTPYLYEYYSIAEGDLIAPERSIYAGNMATNRQMGAMALGELYEGRLGYATGIFNGPRRSFQDFNSAKDLIGYVNSRPFLKSERFKALNYLNLGGSFAVGYQNDPAQPQAFRTANDETASSAADSLSPTFLSLNNNVVEQGERNQWAGHMVWFYKSRPCSASMAEAWRDMPRRTARPRPTFPTTATWFRRPGSSPANSSPGASTWSSRGVTSVSPRASGPGAIEVYGRFSTFDFSKDIFTAGLADPNLWSNHAWATDIGLNWYLNFYTKLYLDWQHSEFGSPVVIAPNKFGPTRDLFWIRFQVFF